MERKLVFAELTGWLVEAIIGPTVMPCTSGAVQEWAEGGDRRGAEGAKGVPVKD
jgi:hypothetical protein